MYQIVNHYRDDPALRASFNRLAEKTFGLNFENWYRMGYWGENYDPYSVVIDGEVAANVSVNRTDMLIGGERKRLVQLGTVMTEERCRHQGMIRAIMEQIDRDCGDADGIYLFANDSVVDFYPRFGFRKMTEQTYSRRVCQPGARELIKLPMDSPKNREVLRRAMEKSTFRCGCEMVDNPGLIFFYAAQFMQECVYYCIQLDAYVIAELEEDTLLIHNVFGGSGVTLEAVIRAFGADVRQVQLGFTPVDTAGFTVSPLTEEDTTTFVRGSVFDSFETKKLRFPSLAHA